MKILDLIHSDPRRRRVSCRHCLRVAVAAAADLLPSLKARQLPMTPRPPWRPLAPSTTTADGREVSLVKLSETRVSRTVYDYVFNIVVKNNATALTNGFATLTNVGTGTTIVRGSVPLGEVDANATVEPFGTITLRHDRALPFDASALVWSITNSTAPVNRLTIPADVAAAAAKIAADPQIKALLDEQSTPAMAKSRWNNFLELVRIPSPSREEFRSVG